MSRTLRSALAFAFAAASLTAPCSCSSYVDGLVFLGSDGPALRVASDSDGGASVQAGSVTRYKPESAYRARTSEDLAVSMRGYGSVRVRLLPDGRDPEPLASAEAVLARDAETELRLRLEPGMRVSSIELSAVDGRAEVLSLAVLPVFEGYSRARARVTIGRGVVSGEGPGLYSVRTPVFPGDGSSVAVRLAADGEVRMIAVGPGGRERIAAAASVRGGDLSAVPTAFFGDATAVVVESGSAIASVGVEAGRGAPLSDLHAILSMPAPAGDYSIYRWDVLPATLVLDFADYDTQDRYLKRLAFFAEKPGFRGRLAGDGEIAGLHGWNAHDYPAFTLAAFYALAAETGFALNEEEERFRELLLERGVLRLGAGGLPEEGEGAVISITRESSDELRRRFIDHEASHALFFQDPEYRALSARLWEGLGPEASFFWKTHLAWRSYDLRDEYLCVNELQAYLTQQSVKAARSYFMAVSLRLAEAYPDRAERLARDEAAALESIRACGEELDAYLRRAWGLSAGRFGRVAGRFTDR
ncbi:MAG: hypothetical protein H7A27_09355 [Spirochaetaceae bacterium]|nr:hypothetical protein [Spirochaetaceae bacterium]